MTIRAVIYARFSSSLQSESSIEDQVRQARGLIEAQGWSLVQVYSDAAVSGATTLRPGYQKLLEDARDHQFDVVVAEALDRLSRDQEDIAGLYKQLSFAAIKLLTLAEGEINELHVGLKGTMNALFLKDLAIKTRRGLEGRVRQGRSGGGISYGYDLLDERDANGDRIAGGRSINEAEAAIIRRIFTMFAKAESPRAIACALNAEGIPGPRNGTWGPSSIYGNWRRGTGILNNELYIGRLVWNRQRFIKDPTTGKRQARLNPESEWIIEEVPALRIVSQDLWNRVKARQERNRRDVITRDDGVRAERARRPRYLLSGLLRCGTCGGGVSKISADRYGCSNARNRGTCDNMVTIRRDVLEASVLAGLKDHLMHPDLVKEFVAEYHAELNRLRAGADQADRLRRDELTRVERQIRRIIEAIKDGMRTATMKSELDSLEARKTALEAELENAPSPLPRLHPNLAELYRRKVANLHAELNREETRTEAAEALRDLIDEIRLVPEDGELAIELHGDLAAIFALSRKDPRGNTSGAQITLVAGVGFEPTTFRL